MTVRNLFPLLFVAAAAPAFAPETASAQCWWCDDCAFPSNAKKPEMCMGRLQGPPVGFKNCVQNGLCTSKLDWKDWGWCLGSTNAAATGEETAQLRETLAAIRARTPIPADGPFVYLTQGEDFVVRRKCDGAEVGRVAIAEVRPVPIALGG